MVYETSLRLFHIVGWLERIIPLQCFPLTSHSLHLDTMADHKLTSLNSVTLGATMPEVTLADGTVLHTGTVGYVVPLA